MTTTKTIDEVIERLKSAVTRHEDALEEWGNDFKGNPHYALEWSEPTFEAAARLRVCSTLLAWAEGVRNRTEAELADLAAKYTPGHTPNAHHVFWAWIKTEAPNYIRFRRSSSRTANILQDYESEAWVNIVYGPGWSAW